MANLAASATQIAGQTLVRTASTLAISTATSYISRAFDTRNFEGPRLDSLQVQTSRDGAPMARVFGRVRLAGQVIWASHVRETSTESPVGGKGGGPTQTEFSYTISFAVGLCEGEISGVDRIWANGSPLETAGLDMRIYRGTEDQTPDPILTATEGGNVPAFRGTAYIVFEDFPLADFGNRLPQLNVEIIRSGRRNGRLEALVQSVNLLPGSGEFAYAADVVEEGVRPGETLPLNMNNLSGKADIELALDQLQAQLPNCKNVSIISSWFGTSTDISDCAIRPGVERRSRNIRNADWQVGRHSRSDAYVVSSDIEGRPNYGGTPSDDSLIQAIQSIKTRGMSVTLYPFILMDTDGFPWRGRLTGPAADVTGFFGAAEPEDFSSGTGLDHHRATDEGFRNFILNHANLARRAGGVDRFVIGSEMIGLTTIRTAENDFPAVTQLARLAGDVKAMLGVTCDLTYAADWSEYFGYHPQDGSGDVFFHLDELWSHPAIDAIGIDAYFPLSDWREGAHLDGEMFGSIYDENYLRSNIEGGEGFEWFYASDEDRIAQNRSPISDWIYRYKDLRNWWSNEHQNRVGGVQQSSTSWVPESKPFWLTEVGCPAVRFGANQPNVFSDSKSNESKFPYFSDGSRDDLIQRRYLETLLGYWNDTANNPVSSVYGERMLNMSATSVWAWDARPFPDFPARAEVWLDGGNWQTGHWINGRVGGVPVGDIIEEICEETGLKNIDVSGVTGLLSGFIVDRPMRGRDALAPLLSVYELTLSENEGVVEFVSLDTSQTQVLSFDDLMAQMNGPIQFSVEDNMTSLRDVRLTFIDAGLDYQTATFSARKEQAETVRVLDISVPIVMDTGQARNLAERQLARSEPTRCLARLAVTPKAAETLQAGSVVTLPDTEGLWQISRLRHGAKVDIDLAALPEGDPAQIVAGGTPTQAREIFWISEPVALGFDMPGMDGLQVGALMNPFRSTDISGAGETITLTSAVKIGALLSPLSRGPISFWDRTNELDLWMPSGALFAMTEDAVLAGANRLAIETSEGWEIIGVADATLIGAETYRLKTLLRGLQASDDMMVDEIAAGARVIVLDDAVGSLDVSTDFIGTSVELAVQSSGRSGVGDRVAYDAAYLRPLSIVHVNVEPDGTQTRVTWISRRTDDANEVDTNAMFEIDWGDGVLTVNETCVLVPLTFGSRASISVTPVDNLAGRGRSVEIRV